jgi:E-phenylitaconyl-CoA hydratase
MIIEGYQNIIYEKRDRTAIITVNRPERMNSMDPATNLELYKAWMDFKDDNDLWVAVLTGAGNRAFSAGNDLKAMSEAQAQGRSTASVHLPVPFGGMTEKVEIWKPMIAAINGYCLAGGLETALACDIRIAVPHATFGFPEPQRAIVPGAGGTQRLPRYIPMAWAMEILLTARPIDAEAALRCGLISRIVPAEELMPTALKIAEDICSNGPLAVRAVKELAIRGRDMALPHGLAFEDSMSREITTTEDAKEGPLAFVEKRPPQFKGR